MKRLLQLSFLLCLAFCFTGKNALAQPLTVTIAGQQDVLCNGDSTGGAFAQALGGTQPYTWQWDDPNMSTDQFIIGVPAGTYIVVVTDANGTTATASVTISEPPAITVVSTGSNESTCGACDGSATANATGGTPGFTYSWSNGSMGQTITGLCSGIYIVTVTDANNCSAQDTVIINANSGGLGLAGNSTPSTSCTACDGSATVSPGNGTPPFVYLWDDPNNQTTQTATGLCPGIYTVTVQDANGCIGVETVTVANSGGSGITVNTTASDPLCPGNCDGQAAANATGGQQPYTYQWDDPNSQTGQTAGGLCAGTYTVFVTDANGCSETASVVLTDPQGMTLTTSAVDATCGQSDGEATVGVTGGTSPYTYLWNDPSTQTTATATGLAGGTYTVTVTDANGCTATATATVGNVGGATVNPISTNATCSGACDGTVDAIVTGGTSPYTYDWTDGNGTSVGTSANLTGLCADTYTVTVTDANGCVSTAQITVSDPAPLTSNNSSVDASCNGSCDGEATVSISGGTTPYSYSWDDPANQTTATATGLCAGLYIATVTDANGCMTMQTFVINEPTPITLSMASTDATCGATDGTATANVTGGSGPYTYLWDDPSAQTTATATGLGAGSYTVIVTDANGCSETGTTNVANPGAPTVNATATDVSCAGAADGSATATATGGSTPYTYQWNDPSSQTTQTATGLGGGLYSVQVTDASGCTGIDTVTVNEPNPIMLSATTTDEMMGNDGSIDLTVTGGTPPYTYDWDNDGTGDNDDTEDLSGLTGGTYIVTVTDANGCTDILTVVVSSQVSVGTIDIFADVTVYPNPTTGQLNVQLSDLNVEEFTLNLIDQAGRVIESRTVNTTSSQEIIELDLQDVESGIYFINMVSENGSILKKVVKH